MSLWKKWLYDKAHRKEVHFIVNEEQPKRKWKYFSEEEVEGLAMDLVYKLDRARELYGFPIIITSGFRTEDQNDAVGGVKNSEHLTGQGCDIRAPLEPYLREKLAWALGAAGFRRYGTYSRHYHLGISQDHPNPAFWVGDYK